MSTGVLSPDPRLRELSDVGVVLPGALLHTYVAGTPSTPLQTTSDAAGLVPNLNPLVASAGGLFGPIYLQPGVAYKYVLTDADGGAIWTQDPVGVGGVAQGGTGAATLTAHGVLVGAGTSAIVATAAGTAGQPLRSNGAAADPAFGDIIQTTTLTGAQNDFALTPGCTRLRCNNATLLTITGFAAGYDGQEVVIESVGAGQVDLPDRTNTGSIAANRTLTTVTVGITSLAAGVGTAKIKYDADVATLRWRLTAHEQGAWLAWTPAWKGSGGQTGQVYTAQTGRYKLSGRTVFFQGRLTLSTLGTLTGTVQIGPLPYTVSAAGAYHDCRFGFFSALTTAVVNLWGFIPPSGTVLQPQMLTAASVSSGNVAQANLSATTDVIFGGQYEVD